MLPISTQSAPAVAAQLTAQLDDLLRLVERVSLPEGDLDGWASLCAGEYRMAVHRLALRVGDVESALRWARHALTP